MEPHQMPLDVSEQVKEALKNNQPVVALESTIITHGRAIAPQYLPPCPSLALSRSRLD